jgi:hypothetical protein
MHQYMQWQLATVAAKHLRILRRAHKREATPIKQRQSSSWIFFSFGFIKQIGQRLTRTRKLELVPRLEQTFGLGKPALKKVTLISPKTFRIKNAGTGNQYGR